jgi:hypothetical protein
VDLLATGRTTDADHWSLTTELHPPGRHVGVGVTTAGGHRCWGTGCVLEQHPQTDLVQLTTGSDDAGPSTLIVSARADVRAVVVRLSDGTREDLQLHALPDRSDVRVAVLVYPRRLDVHRIDLYDAAGVRFPD